MKKMYLLFLLNTLFFSLFIGQQAYAASVPAPVGDIYVQDFAHILSTDEKKELMDIGTYLDDHTEAQIAVLTIDSLDNVPVEEYAVQAFREYGLGSTEKNNGVLLLLAVEDRKIYIEVGYGLEGRLPDGKVGRILDTYALPYLEQDNLATAITNTYKELFNEVADEYQLDKQVETKSFEYGYDESEGPSIITIIIFTLIFLGIIFLDFRFFGGALTLSILRMLALFARNRGGGGGGGSRGGGGGSAGGGGAGRSW